MRKSLIALAALASMGAQFQAFQLPRSIGIAEPLPKPKAGAQKQNARKSEKGHK